MKISEVVGKIDLRDSQSYFTFTKKWIDYVTSKRRSSDISELEWSELFGRSNPVAGIDRGELLDRVKISNGEVRETNEKKSIISKWDSQISPFIETILNISNPSSKIVELKKLETLLLHTIIDSGGRRMVLAINRLLATFFPDYFICIPNYENLKEFIDLLHKYIDEGNTIVKSNNWIDDCYQVKVFLNKELRDDHLVANAWRFYTYLKGNQTSIKPNVNSTALPSMDTRNKYEGFLKLLLNNRNLILTGAPGTGKTFLAMEIAKAMGAKYKLVQFHPSYDYTDFVEGLRPVKTEASLGFQRKDGVFKTFCKEALNADGTPSSSFEELYQALAQDISNGTIKTYRTLSGNVYPLKVIDGEIQYGCLNNGTKYRGENVANIKLIFEHCLSNPDEVEFSFKGLRTLISKLTNGRISTLDPSEYSWTIKELLARRDKTISKDKYVFIIDEINRGEISKIFGELFYSIDPGYRGDKGKIETQYQNLIPKEGDVDFDSSNVDIFRHGFFIPENVYIIGTMNDIDRSVESMDFAMRRRFAWKEITAESRQDMLDEDEAWRDNGKPSQEIIDQIKARMDNLNACIIDQYGDEEPPREEKIGLSKAYQIGAAYFLKYGLYNNFDDLWSYHIEGLLYEYLRGKTLIDKKIEKLHQAYNDTSRR